MQESPDDRFAARGISFRCPTFEDRAEIWRGLNEHFLTSEPVSRSLGTANRSNAFERGASDYMYKSVVCQILRESGGSSVVACDKEGRIIGIKLSHGKRVSDKREWLPDLRWLRHLRCLVPGQVAKAVAMMDMFRTLKYDPHLQMEEHGTDNMFIGEILSVFPEAQGMGLGRELVRRSVDLAAAQGFTHYFTVASGIYSQKIFSGLGFRTTCVLEYAGFLDMHGRVVVDDAREHTCAKAMIYRLRSGGEGEGEGGDSMVLQEYNATAE